MMKNNRIQSWESYLVQRVAQGETDAFDLITDLHRAALTSQALRVLRNFDDASDAVQETFVKALRAMPEFDSSRPLRPWLARICSNACMDQLRLRKRDGEPLESHEHLIASNDDLQAQTVAKIQEETLVRAMQSMPHRYRATLFLRHFRHMEVAEIAKTLGKPEGTVKSWLFRARALLAKELAIKSLDIALPTPP